MSIRLKIILAMFMVTVAIAMSAVSSAYSLLQESLLEQLRARLQTIAYLGGAALDLRAAERLLPLLQDAENPQRIRDIQASPDYLRLHQQLNHIRAAEPDLIRYAYILVPGAEPGSSRFLVDADVLRLTALRDQGRELDEPISHFGAAYDISGYPFIRQAFGSRNVVIEDDLTYDPEFQSNSLSAYMPLYRQDGGLIGILGVDLRDKEMQAALARSRFYSLLIFVIALIGATLLSIYVGGRVTHGIRVLHETVRRFAMKDFGVRAPVISGDEVGKLSMSFNDMAQTIDTHAKYLESLLTAYGRFVPHSFLKFLHKDSVIDLKLGDHVQKEMTVLFSDIRSFTRLSESMTPAESFKFINAYLQRVGPVIREHGGVIDKYIGDAVMALFDASPAFAIRAALDMQKRVREHNAARLEAGREPLAIGVGLHTGKLILGTVGEDERMNSTVISDAVNLASRLEGVTKLYGAGVVISGAVLACLPEDADFGIRFLDKIQVKGKREQVLIYEVIDADPDVLRASKRRLLDRWQKAVDLYYARQFAEALAEFSRIAKELPEDIPARLFMERAARCMANAPEIEWDGVEVLDSK